MNLMESTFLSAFIIILLAVVYVLQSVLLSELHRIMYGRGSWMAWVPVTNVYLLGTLTMNPIVGSLLVIAIFLSIPYVKIQGNTVSTFTILPQDITSSIYRVYLVTTLILFIYAIYKYFKLRKNPPKNVQTFYPRYANYSNQNMTIPQPIQKNKPSQPLNIPQTSHQQMYQNNAQQHMEQNNQFINQNNQFVDNKTSDSIKNSLEK